MAVIELARPGQEATTYELIVTVGNAASVVNGIISTQLLTPMHSVGCDDDSGQCSSDTVVVTSKSSYENSHKNISKNERNIYIIFGSLSQIGLYL